MSDFDREFGPSWRRKTPKDMNAAELRLAVRDTEEALRAAETLCESETISDEDSTFAYVAVVSARKKLADLRRASDTSRFDVV